MSRKFRELGNLLSTDISAGEGEVRNLRQRVLGLEEMVRRKRRELSNMEVLEQSGVIDIFEKIIDSGILGQGAMKTNPEIYFPDDATVLLLFGRQEARFRVSHGWKYMDPVSERHLYYCAFSTDGKNIFFDNNKKDHYQKTMRDNLCVDYVGEPLSSMYYEGNSPFWMDTKCLGGVGKCIKTVMSTYCRTEKVKNFDMGKLEEMLGIEKQGVLEN